MSAPAPRLLIVDDDRDLVRSLCLRFRAKGFEVWFEHDGTGVIAAAGLYAPDAIVLDLRMPRMDGFEVLEKLGQDRTTAAIPVLVLSASIADRARTVALGLGASRFLAKPFESTALLDAVRSVLPQPSELHP